MRFAHVIFAILTGLKVATFVPLLLPQLAIAETEAESLELIAQVYADNREKLQSFTCRFKVTEGIAPTAEAGLAGKFEPVSVQDGLWIVDRGDVRYELKCVIGGLSRSELLRIGPDKSGFTPLDCSSRFELFSAKHGIRGQVSSLLNTANLHEKASSDVVMTPVSMGAMGGGEIYSPFRLIREHQAGSRYCKYLGKARLGDRTVDMIETGRQKVKGEEPTSVWHLDVARGAIPLRKTNVKQDGSVEYEFVNASVRRLENGAYVSERSVFLSQWPTGWKTIIIELISMDLNVPARELFAMTLPERCKVLCMKDLRLNFRVAKPEVMHVDDLQNWVKKCETRGAERIRELEKKGITHARPPNKGISRWLVLALSLIAFVGISVIVRRFLRS